MSEIDKTLKIYLAGKMGSLTLKEMNGWRVKITDMLFTQADSAGYKLDVINPVMYFNTLEHKHQTEEEAMDFDLRHVATSDVVIVNLKDINTSIGTCIEVYRAWTLGIPVVAYGMMVDWIAIHPWVKRCITRHETKKTDVCNYIREFYMI